MKILIFIWKRALLFSFLLIQIYYNSQVIIKYTNNEKLEKILLNRKEKQITINKNQINDVVFEKNDKVLIDNKQVDFYYTKDTLYIFDKTKEIEGITINPKLRKEEIISNKRKLLHTTVISSSIKSAAYFNVKKDNNKNIFLKSFYIYPTKILYTDGNLVFRIQKVGENGFPDEQNILIEFKTKMSNIKNGKNEIILPKIIKIPDEGAFLTITHDEIFLKEIYYTKCVSNTMSYQKTTAKSNWSKYNFPVFFYKLKILN